MQSNQPGPNENESSSMSHSTTHGGPPVTAPILTFDLESELELLRRQQNYQTGEPIGRTLVKQPDLRIVLMTSQKGGRLVEHHASGPISLQAVEGRVRLRLSDATVDLSTGQLLALEPGIPHDVEAIEDCAFLLTIGRTTYHEIPEEKGNEN